MRETNKLLTHSKQLSSNASMFFIHTHIHLARIQKENEIMKEKEVSLEITKLYLKLIY